MLNGYAAEPWKQLRIREMDKFRKHPRASQRKSSCWAWYCGHTTSTPGRQRLGHHRKGSLASQSNRTGELQTNERSCLKESDGFPHDDNYVVLQPPHRLKKVVSRERKPNVGEKGVIYGPCQPAEPCHPQILSRSMTTSGLRGSGLSFLPTVFRRL